MKDIIVIWGTGKIATEYMKYCNDRLSSYYSVVGFLDSSFEKRDFFGRPVYNSPREITDIFSYIVIMVFYKSEEIREIIKKKYPEFEQKTLVYYDLFSRCINNERMNYKSQSVLFLGDKQTYDKAEYRAKFTFARIKYDNVGDESYDTYDYIFLCPPRLMDDIKIGEYERYLLKCIKKKLSKSQSRPEIISWHEWHFYMECERVIEDRVDAEETFYIIAPTDPMRGWGNLLPQILGGISYSKMNNYIPIVDMQNVQSLYLDKKIVGFHNAWTDYFEPLNDYQIEDAYSKGRSILCGEEGFFYEKYWGDLFLKDDIKKEIEEWKNRYFENQSQILGVVYRGTDYHVAYRHSFPIEKDAFMQEVEKFMSINGYKKIFLATEVEEMVDTAMERFGKDLICYPQRRFHEDERRFLYEIRDERENGTYLRGREYLIVLILLSECGGIYGQENGALRIARIMNHGMYRNEEVIM